MLEVIKIQESTPLHISLLQDLSARRKSEDESSTYAEVTIQVVPRRVDLEPFAELRNVLEVQFLVSLFVGGLPVLLRPKCLTKIEVTEPTHEGLSYGIQLMKGRIPHLKYVD